MQAKMTLIGLYNYLYDEDLDDPDVLFSGLTVPADTYDLDLLKATILLRGGGFEVMYPDPDFLIPMISACSAGGMLSHRLTALLKTMTATKAGQIQAAVQVQATHPAHHPVLPAELMKKQYLRLMHLLIHQKTNILPVVRKVVQRQVRLQAASRTVTRIQAVYMVI